MSKKVILTQKQLDEIVGGNISYLDNVDSDFNEFDGANYVHTGGKTEDSDAEPITTDKFGKTFRRDSSFYGLNRNISMMQPIYVTETKAEWEKKLLETNQNLVNKTYGDDKNRVSNTNASTLKWRYGAAKKKAQSSDPTVRQQGISTMKTMEKNNPNLKQIETQYNSAMNNDANLKKSAHDRGEDNVYQKSGGVKAKQLSDVGDSTQVITYEGKVNEAKSIRSKKLLDILRAHGGFYRNNGMHKPYPLTNAEIDKIPDDRVIGVVDWNNITPTIQKIMRDKTNGFVPGDEIDHARLMDGMYVLFLVKNAHLLPSRENEKDTFKDTWAKYVKRNEQGIDGAKYYKWKSEDAHNLVFNNPYYSDWSDESKKRIMQKIKDDYKK